MRYDLNIKCPNCSKKIEYKEFEAIKPTSPFTRVFNNIIFEYKCLHCDEYGPGDRLTIFKTKITNAISIYYKFNDYSIYIYYNKGSMFFGSLSGEIEIFSKDQSQLLVGNPTNVGIVGEDIKFKIYEDTFYDDLHAIIEKALKLKNFK